MSGQGKISPIYRVISSKPKPANFLVLFWELSLGSIDVSFKSLISTLVEVSQWDNLLLPQFPALRDIWLVQNSRISQIRAR